MSSGNAPSLPLTPAPLTAEQATAPLTAEAPTLDGLTPQQRSAVDHPPTPLLIVAGAGSGKTTVMAQRIATFVRTGIEAHRVMALTFSNKAAANLRERVNASLGTSTDVYVHTYHGLGAALIREHAAFVPRARRTNGSLRLLDRAQSWQLLLDVFDEFAFDRRKVGKPSIIVRDALALASRCADHLVAVETVMADCERLLRGRGRSATRPKVKEAAAKRLELCQVVAEYERRKDSLGFLDHGDQIALAVKLLSDNAELAESLREEHPFVLLDEYQDTNYAQRRLLQLVYPQGSAICAVGDDMQSIYAFRGAHLGNILRFERHFPPATEARLEVNFRSGAALVDLANRVQAQVAEARPKELQAREGAPPTTIECFLAADDREEAQTIAAEIAARGAPWADHAVLCRKRKLIPAIVEALAEREVPVEVVGLGGLLSRPEIVDVVAWLELLAGVNTVVPAIRVLQGPRFRFGMRDLAALARYARTLRPEGSHARIDMRDSLAHLDAVPDLSPEAWQRGKQLAAELDDLLARSARLGLADLLDAVIERTRLWDAVDGRGRENLLRLVDLAARFEPLDPGTQQANMRAFLEYLHLIVESEDDPAEAVASGVDAVQVMTIHQAKGLEFPTVYVPGLAGADKSRSKIFPDERSAENGATQSDALPLWLRADNEGIVSEPTTATEEIDLAARARRARRDEEWRLFYVAITRARTRLVCSAAHWYPGPAEPQGPSPFYEFVSRQSDLVHERFRRDVATQNPAFAAMERRAAALSRMEGRREVKPGPQRRSPSETRPNTWRRAPKIASGQNTLLAGDAGRAVPLSDRPPVVATTLSASAVVAYARCPKQFYWMNVRPLPRRDSPAARFGTEVHRWIEERADRQLGLFDHGFDVSDEDGPEDNGPIGSEPDGSGPDGSGPDGSKGAGIGDRQPAAGPTRVALSDYRNSFLASPFAALDPLRVEAPFAIPVADRLVRGRIDAVYFRNGRLELVDWKTGRAPHPGEMSGSTQLDLYGLAAIMLWGAEANELRTTYCYLRAGDPPELVSYDWDGERGAAVRTTLERLMADLDELRFDPYPGAWCTGCDFRQWCPAANLGDSSAPINNGTTHRF